MLNFPPNFKKRIPKFVCDPAYKLKNAALKLNKSMEKVVDLYYKNLKLYDEKISNIIQTSPFNSHHHCDKSMPI